MDLEVIEETGIEKSSVIKRKLSEKQMTALAAGRIRMAEGRARKAAEKAEAAAKAAAAAPPVEEPAAVKEHLEKPAKKTRQKQVIVFADESDTEDEAPQIIIKKRTAKPKETTPPPTPAPLPKLKRV